MIYTGRYSKFEDLEMNPEKPFLADIERDLLTINQSFDSKTAKEIKLKIIEKILKNI